MRDMCSSKAVSKGILRLNELWAGGTISRHPTLLDRFLDGAHLDGLRPLGALLDLELNSLIFLK